MEALVESKITYQWITHIDRDLWADIKQMLKDSIEDAAILGFSDKSTDSDYDRFLENLNSSLKSKSVYLLELRCGPEVAGMTIVVPSKMPNCKHIADLTKGFIRKKYRGRQGVLGAFRAIVEKCRAEQHDLLTLDVREGSNAHKLWVSFGFKLFGRLERYAIVSDEVFAGVYLQQSVDELSQKIGGE